MCKGTFKYFYIEAGAEGVLASGVQEKKIDYKESRETLKRIQQQTSSSDYKVQVSWCSAEE